MPKLGIIVNPVAGLGGRVGLKGSDGPAVQQLALARGARPEAPLKAAEALGTLAPLAGGMEVLAWPGAMGADVCRQAGFDPRVGPAAAGGVTSGADTEAAARWMLAESVDLILFVGGDGTARDICSAVGERIPALGVPAGVKIHSSVFAVTPRSAGMAARRFLEQGAGRCRTAEVMDIDEDAFRNGKVCARLFGALQVPDADRLIQGAKVGGGPSEARVLADIAQGVIEQMRKDPACVHIIGPGTTTRAVKRHFGIPGTLLGVDVVWGDRAVAEDADERTLLKWIAGRPARIIVTVIGGQGHLFGRGNQQISPRVIRSVGRQRIIVVATQEKLLGLNGRPLLVDTGDGDLDRDLAGHMRVVTGYRHTTMCRVGL
ncbi:MAG: ATP-NAD kinase family protein [Desulfobacterales bacterium]|nr:ATP-NAD kinase family protein [Desulfobacterales bacterium]